MRSSITKKDLIFACTLIISTFMLVYKLLTPIHLVISINGAAISSESLPKFFTYSDVVVMTIFSILLGFSTAQLIYHVEITGKTAGEAILEERKRMWEEIAKTLKDDEAKIYKAIIESGGIINQSELVEKTGLSKASVSRPWIYWKAEAWLRGGEGVWEI